MKGDAITGTVPLRGTFEAVFANRETRGEKGMRKVLIPLGVVALAIPAAAVGGRGGVAAGASARGAQAHVELVKQGRFSIGADNPASPPWFAGGETKGRPWKI